MTIKQIALTFFALASQCLGMYAAPLKVCDFEDYEIGTTWTMWSRYGGDITSTATVVADPANASNKVLHVVLKNWNCNPEFTVPGDVAGSALTSQYASVRCRLYRSSGDANDYKQFTVFLGDDELYRDEGYPYQGDKSTWQTRTYALAAASDGNTSKALRLGIHCDVSDYYLDDIQLVGEFDDYTEATDGELFDFCVNNTSSNYSTIDKDLYIPAGVTANVRTSRYSQWTGKVAGEGMLNIYAGGERSYIGTQASKGTTYPDWSKMTGEVHVYPYKDVISSCGFYGLLLSSGTFTPDNEEQARPNTLFANSALVMHSGTTLAAESGTRGFKIGELQLEEGAEIRGYYKNGSANSYYVVGGKNTDAVLAGKIYASNSGNKVGIIKEGKGTYTITGNENNIGSGVTVNAGALLVCNDAAAAEAGKKSGATGNTGMVMVAEGARLGGNGSIAATTELYGNLQPGTEGYDTLTFADYTTSKGVKLTLHPKSYITINARSAEEHSMVKVNGTLTASNVTQDFQTSDAAPRLKLLLADDATLSINDEIVLLSCSSEPADGITFDVRYPKRYTFTTEQRVAGDGTFTVVARVTSLDDNPNYVEDDDIGGETAEIIYPDEDITADKKDNTPLRTYADKLGKNIGVAAASYRYDLSNDNVAPTAMVGREFNIIVGENEMKFDATEPSQNYFSYGGSDAIMWLANRKMQEVRGHTLAWHSQVPSWVSSDGKKNNNGFTRRELLDILKNHIYNVVGKYKGKIREWDVVNEVLDDDQSIVRTTPGSYKLRPSIWATYIGEEFIDSAFVWAHEADPSAKLYINDYGVEFMGSSKAEAYFNLVKRLQASGRPIDGCGLQCHLTTGQLDTLKLENNIQRYAPLGLNCIITELDITLANPSAANALEAQAKEYAAIARVWLRNDNCPTLMVWGISDNHSWRQNKPLMYDANCQAKLAYYYVHAQLRKACDDDPTAVQRAEVQNTGKSAVRYNLLGQRAKAGYTGIVVEEGRKVFVGK